MAPDGQRISTLATLVAAPSEMDSKVVRQIAAATVDLVDLDYTSATILLRVPIARRLVFAPTNSRLIE